MWGVAFCGWILGIRCVYTFHSVFPTRKITFLYHCFLRWSAKNIFKCRFHTISDSVFNHELNLFHNKTTKILNWYSNNRYYPASIEEKNRVRQSLHIPLDAVVIITVGSCSNIKRHSEVIKSLPKILAKNNNCIYIHLGSGCLEIEEKVLAKELGVIENIRFYGNQSDVRKFLIASDVYIMTSKFEGISLTTLEALACEIPAILYNVQGLRDFNKNAENCIIISEDPKLISEKVDYLIHNPQYALKLANQAKLFVDSSFSMNKNAHSILELYN
jgi:glycosyltransferase involved in cell wall biosynthesis